MMDPNESEQTYDLTLLEKSARKWLASEGLRIVYGSIYQEIQKRLSVGPTLELGSGIGGIKAFIPDTVTSDIIRTPYVDIACSAYEIPSFDPKTGGRWSNIIAVDVLHHLCMPMDFFRSAAAALGEEGKIILVEPAGTLFGRVFYGMFHPEPLKPRAIVPPFIFDAKEDSGEFANMAMGTSLFVRHRDSVDPILHDCGLKIGEITFRDLLAYPFSGGYSSPQLLPAPLIKGLLILDKRVPQWLLRWISLRMLVVIEMS